MIMTVEEYLEERRLPSVLRIPPGEYFIGDPCYPKWTDVEWGQLSSSIKWSGGGFVYPVNVLHTPDNKKWAVASRTQWGDGRYMDQYNNHYLVDAGMIGVVPTLCVEPPDPDLGKIHTFETPFAIAYDHITGRITIGNDFFQLTIPTGDE